MARSALVINLNLEERMILERLAFDPTNPQLAKRAGIVLDSANGMLGKDIAQKYSVNESKVTKWRNRYLSDGPKGLLRQRPVKDDSQLTNEEVIELIRETIDEPPPEGESSWTSVLVAEKLGISIQKCKRLLTEASITLERVRSFSVISDSIGPTNCVGIVGIYLSNKQCALILDVGRHITVEDKPRSVLDTRNREASEEYKQLFSQGENLCMSKVLDTATSFLGKGIPYRTRLSCGDFIQRTIADLSNPIGNSNYRVLLWTEEHSKETVTIMDSSIDLIHTSDLNKWNTEVQAVANMCGLALDDPQHNQFFVPSVGCFVSASSDVDEPFCWHRVNGTDVQEHVCEQASVPLAVAVNPGNMVISISYLGTDGKEIITSTTEYPVDIPDPANVHINSKDAAVNDFGFFERGVNAAVQQAECDFSASYAEKVKKKHESVSLTSRPIESILGTIQFPFCKELNLPRRAHFFSPEAFRFMFHSVSAASYRSATSLFNIAYRQNAPNDMNTSSIHQEMNRAFSDIRKYETELVKKVFRENGLTITGKLKKGKRWKDSIVNPSPSLLSTDGARQITSQEIVDAIERFNYDKPDYLKINHDDVLESIERYPGGAVYIAPDGCCTHHQKDKRNRYKDGVRYRDGEKMGERVNTYNVNIQVNGEEYTVTADSLQSALRLTLAFLLNNRLLENRQLIIFTDGGKDIKKQCSSIFADIPHQFIIDWYHLRKKCREFFSMALQSGRKYKASRAEVSKAFFNILWVGNLEGAKAYLKTIDHSLIKSGEQLAKMMAYLDRKQYAFTCFAIRRMLKLRLSSNLVEKDNNVIISTRQKKNGMSWSTEGSTGLGLLTCLQHNDEMENWLTNHTLHFSMRSMRKKISA